MIGTRNFINSTDSPFISAWLSIGRRNPWIREAEDPFFGPDQFARCDTLEDLANTVAGSWCWCVGSAFWCGEICLINQAIGGEWLVIKGPCAFESFTVGERWMDEGKLLANLRAIEAATVEECRALEYGKRRTATETERV